MKQSLEKRIILFSFFILSMTILANTAMEIAVFRKEYIHEIALRSRSHGTSLKDSITRVLALGMELHGIKGLSEKCREIIQVDPEIAYCVVTDTAGKPIYASDPAYAVIELPAAAGQPDHAGKDRLPAIETVTAAGSSYYNIRVPVLFPDSRHAATVHIGFPHNAINQKVYAIILRSTLVFLVFFIVSFALVILFVKRSIIAPVTDLLDGVTRIARGDFGTRIPPLEVNELNQLGLQINAMSQALETHDRELHSNYEELARTHEQLNESYNRLELLSSDLQSSETMYKRLQDEAGDAIVILDGSGTITVANRMAEAFFGLPARELLGHHISSLLIRLNTVDMPYHLKKILDAFTTPYEHDEISITGGSGETLVGRVHASCITAGERSLLQIIIRDVTREHETLVNLENSAAGLARLNRMKDSFIGLASHELKTPLTVIMGYSELLLTDMRSELSEAACEMVLNISTAAARLDNIVRDMIDVSMIDQRQMELSSSPVNINSIIEDAVREFHIFFNQRRQEVTVSLAPDLPALSGDSTRLMQLMTGIIGNAIKFTPDGGRIAVTTELKVPEGPESGVGREPGSEHGCHLIEITVADNGVGIAREDQRRVFDKFFEAGSIEEHSSGKTAFQARGAGLGLSIAKGIVEMHGGRIWVESPGYDPVSCPGSTFHILFNCCQA